MEILLAIVWYLSLLTPGNYYDQADIYNIAIDNTNEVNYVADNHLTEAIDFYNVYSPEDGGVFLPAYWDKEPVDHTDESLWDWDPLNPKYYDSTDTQGTGGSNGNQSSGGTDNGGN
jgi:hypothetical protein